jgi:hypothetical protein
MEGNSLINLENLRNDIRIKQGREKPIDFFIKLLKILHGAYPIPQNFLDIDIYRHPFELLNMLSKEEKNELLRNIKYHFDIHSTIQDYQNISKKYWTAIYYLTHFISDESRKALLNNDDLLSLFNHYKTEEELIIAEKEISDNIKNKTDDVEFWKDSYCLAKYLKYKKFLEDLYDNFIKSHKKEISDMKNIDNKMNEMSNIIVNESNINQINDNSNSKKKGRRKGSLSPPGYESDEDLRKIAMTEHDFLFDLAEKRKVILIEKLKEYKENKINDEMNKNKNLENTGNKNNENKKSNVENILGENFQDAINFLNRIAQKSKKDKDKIKKAKKREREKDIEKLDKDDINQLHKNNNISTKFSSFSDFNRSLNNSENNDFISNFSLSNKTNKNPINFNNINILNKSYNNINNFNDINTINNIKKYQEENIPDIDVSAVNPINLMEEQINDIDEVGANERVFNECVEVDANYDWSSKYKPIKPRYSNKVKMGFDWNRHNQAHYTSDNLPPKTIQGYRFNIFYPYLVDKTKTPQYKIERCNTPDTCILRFHSGAPYEDIAFKIKNREWDMSEKSGFKNIFDKGILRLYFKFKRFKYKR